MARRRSYLPCCCPRMVVSSFLTFLRTRQGGPCLDLFAQYNGQPFARQHERYPTDIGRLDAGGLVKWVQNAMVLHGIEAEGAPALTPSAPAPAAAGAILPGAAQNPVTVRPASVVVSLPAKATAAPAAAPATAAASVDSKEPSSPRAPVPKAKGSGSFEFRKVAYRIFQEMDEDGNNSLDRKELQALSARLKMHLSSKVLNEAFTKMGGDAETDVDFDSFLGWFSRHKEEARLQHRSKVGTEFKRIATAGVLAKDGFNRLVTATKKRLDLLPPAFDLERDWSSMEIIDSGALPPVPPHPALR